MIGSETVRKYWHHYYSNQQAVIFMVNGCRSQEDTLLDKEVFLSAINHPSLSDLPVLLLVTHQDVQGCRSPDSVSNYVLRLSNDIITRVSSLLCVQFYHHVLDYRRLVFGWRISAAYPSWWGSLLSICRTEGHVRVILWWNYKHYITLSDKDGANRQMMQH